MKIKLMLFCLAAICCSASVVSAKPKLQPVEAAKPVVKKKTAPRMGGLLITSPEEQATLYASREYTVKYLATGAETISLWVLVPRGMTVEELAKGNIGQKFVARKLVAGQAPTGSHTFRLDENFAPFSNLGSSIVSSTKRYDGPIVFRLVKHQQGKNDEVFERKVKVRIPRLRLREPAAGNEVYRGKWYEARWQTLGQQWPQVKLSLMYHSGADIMGEKIVWSTMVPNNGKCRFMVPKDLAKPESGHKAYIMIEEEFPASQWDARVMSMQEVTVR